MKRLLLVAIAALALTSSAYAGNDDGGAGGTYWRNSGVGCQEGTGRTFWHNTYTNEWRCAYPWEV